MRKTTQRKKLEKKKRIYKKTIKKRMGKKRTNKIGTRKMLGGRRYYYNHFKNWDEEYTPEEQLEVDAENAELIRIEKERIKEVKNILKELRSMKKDDPEKLNTEEKYLDYLFNECLKKIKDKYGYFTIDSYLISMAPEYDIRTKFELDLIWPADLEKYFPSYEEFMKGETTSAHSPEHKSKTNNNDYIEVNDTEENKNPTGYLEIGPDNDE